MARKGSIAILIAAMLWSTGGLFIKTVTLDAWGVSLWRSSFAAVTLWVIYMISRPKIAGSQERGWLSPFVMMSALCYSFLLILFVVATKLTTSANAIFLQYTAPIYVLFAEPMMNRSKMKRADLLSVGVSTIAMSLFFFGKIDTQHAWGNIAALLSGVAFAGYALLMKHEHATEATRWRTVILGHLLIIVTMCIVRGAGGMTFDVSNHDLIRLAYLGIVQIGIAYAFFTFGISHVRAIDATLISMVEPVLNPVWVFLGMGEAPNTYAIIGGGLILLVSIVRTVRGSREFTELESARAGE